VAGDIAVYKEGSARPTGGAVVLPYCLSNAPIVFDRGMYDICFESTKILSGVGSLMDHQF